MNTETIGTLAGNVWVALNEADALGVKQLKKIAKAKTEKDLYAALGWLAREGKLVFSESEDGKELIVSLA
ncbi:MAG: winged helix-turn-helix domain-containing protein [Bacteroides sp.]|nr:winged helix-turn-helix domain-containing protein [Bacteroidales bacterium]MBD5251336.1 winged helix-turn-helix domain-containing protein [Barnesiella sp.]MBD5343629.1 winged helix-turn-helix domain-containing protein [Bacteroides sp.]MBD5367977.1 winged helix-turn-helix domain-containing protein [Bacteroides sp.]MDE5828986.1 winged helix-turn-helix domain-containing protein [Duncaniella sp.]